MPPLIGTTFSLIFLYKRHLAKQHISDVVLDEVAETCWDEAQDIAAAAHTHEHTEDGWTQQGQAATTDMDPDQAASIIQSAYKGFAHRKASGDAGDSNCAIETQLGEIVVTIGSGASVLRETLVLRGQLRQGPNFSASTRRLNLRPVDVFTQPNRLSQMPGQTNEEEEMDDRRPTNSFGTTCNDTNLPLKTAFHVPSPLFRCYM